MIKVIESMYIDERMDYIAKCIDENKHTEHFIYVLSTPNRDLRLRTYRDVTRVNNSINLSIYNKHNGLSLLRILLRKGKNIITSDPIELFTELALMDESLLNKYTVIIDGDIPIVSYSSESISRFELFEPTLTNIVKGVPVLTDKGMDYIKRCKCLSRTLKGLSNDNTKVWGNRLLWAMNRDVLTKFKGVTIVAYRFSESKLHGYLKGVMDFDYYHIFNGQDVNKGKMSYDCEELSNLISIYDGECNGVYDNRTTSYMYNTLGDEYIEYIGMATYKYIKEHSKEIWENTMWTAPQDIEDRLSGFLYGYSRSVVPIDNRLADVRKIDPDLTHKTSLCYLYEPTEPKYEADYLENIGVKYNKYNKKLQDVIEWVNRSAVRKGKSVSLYIPTKLTRRLFNNWYDK